MVFLKIMRKKQVLKKLTEDKAKNETDTLPDSGINPLAHFN